MNMDELFNNQMQCHLLVAHYDYARQTGFAIFPAGECCDMQGCVDFFQEKSPGIQTICTISGGQRDTCYQYDGEDWLVITKEQMGNAENLHILIH